MEKGITLLQVKMLMRDIVKEAEKRKTTKSDVNWDWETEFKDTLNKIEMNDINYDDKVSHDLWDYYNSEVFETKNIDVPQTLNTLEYLLNRYSYCIISQQVTEEEDMVNKVELYFWNGEKDNPITDDNESFILYDDGYKNLFIMKEENEED